MAKANVKVGAGEMMGLDAAVFVVGGDLIRVLDRVCVMRGVGREVVLKEALQELEARYGNGGR